MSILCGIKFHRVSCFHFNEIVVFAVKRLCDLVAYKFVELVELKGLFQRCIAVFQFALCHQIHFQGILAHQFLNEKLRLLDNDRKHQNFEKVELHVLIANGQHNLFLVCLVYMGNAEQLVSHVIGCRSLLGKFNILREKLKLIGYFCAF